ncbi:MAG: uncharacterized protein QG652_1260 [Pseudomonadota bacterium]|nr:uncharacterized protein [Pseudomonadota bacterium]
MPSTIEFNLDNNEKNTLLKIAHESIGFGLKHHKPMPVNAHEYSLNLQQHRATFVTLHLHEKLRGCIGTLEAHQPLIRDVAEHAFAAAFHDNRFVPVTADELPQLEIHISILTPATPMQFASEEDLLRQLQPGVDGLILQAGRHRGTFLPSVWEQLPQPEDFLRHLKMKAGLAGNYWSDEVKVSRYATLSIP